MKRALLIIGGVLAAIIALLILGSLAAQLGGPYYDPVRTARESAEIARLERQTARAAALAPLDLGVAVVWKVLAITALVGGLLYLASLGVAHLARFRHERQPDARGLLPVPAAEISDIGRAALAGYHTARIEESRRALPAAHTLTYAPRIDYRLDGRGIPALPAPELEPVAGPPPTFAQLLDSGRIGRGQPLMLGYDLAEGAPIWGSWRDLYSAGVGGAQGGGKSWTAASLIAQSMLNGARVILCDPHAGDEESLTSRLAPLLSAMLLHADDERQIEAAAHYAADELQRRREKKSNDRTPILLVIDEWTSLLRRGLGDTLPAILSDLTQEGRKYGVNALLLAQRWSVDAAGGGDVRNCLTAHYVHRTRADEARMQTGLRGSALPDDTMTLQPGQSYLIDTKGNMRKIATPMMSAGDLERVAGLLGDGSADPVRLDGPRQATAQATIGRVITPPTEAWRKPDDSQMVASQEQATSASGCAIPPSVEAQRAKALFLAGKDLAAVVFELRGVKSSEGRRYQAAAAEIQHLLRTAIS